MDLTTIATQDDLTMIVHLGSALLAGMVVGYERSFHGRPAGFRTHTLVCLASAMLMMITMYQASWVPDAGGQGHTSNLDPTRMAQGIMTGIGFLGAGVIYKEGITIRGLTTAASIWTTAALGILFGAGLYFPAVLATILVVCVLSFFHIIERTMPKNSYVHFNVSFNKDRLMTEAQVKEMVGKFGFRVGNVSYHSINDGAFFEYRIVMKTADDHNPAKFAEYLNSAQHGIRDYQIYPSGD
jgi:putative Mg2+ transporter-C (MgtC) family protein